MECILFLGEKRGKGKEKRGRGDFDVVCNMDRGEGLGRLGSLLPRMYIL